MLCQKCKPLVWLAAALLLWCAFLPACSGRDRPPFITAEVTNVYREVSQVDNFALLYRWEERGETPFLKPYHLRSKELIVELEIPVDRDLRRVDLQTRHIPLEAVDTIAIELTDSGKQIVIGMRSGEQITTTNRFPRALKKGAQTGLADSGVYASGIIRQNGATERFEVDFDLIRSIKILSVRDAR